MADLIRDGACGQLIRLLTRNKRLQYSEERPDFVIPNGYEPTRGAEQQSISPQSQSAIQDDMTDAEKKGIEDAEDDAALHATEAQHNALEQMETAQTTTTAGSLSVTRKRSLLSRHGTQATLAGVKTREELDEAFLEAALSKGQTHAVEPEVLQDGTVIVGWYSMDDPDNPQNWGFARKALASSQICIYTLAVYMGSAIYSPSEPLIMETFGVSHTAASLPLALYVLGYGIGPLLWSPLAEIPTVGRNPPYIATMAIFVIISVPTALTPTYGGLLACRFLQGFFGSPCLATGGASIGDMYSLIELPYVLCIWAFAATCGPALGPLISGFAVAAEGWRWSMWEILWLAGPVFIAMFFLLPETSSANILLRRAKRLRKLTGDERFKAQAEIESAGLDPRGLAKEALVKPLQIIFLDPAVGFCAFYIALLYAINYSFFEAFPLVYGARYGMNAGEQGLVFLTITIGSIAAILVYYAYVHWFVEPEMKKSGVGKPEKRLALAIFGSFFGPIGLFMFAWLGNGKIYWMASAVGVVLFTFSMFLIIQCIFVYLPMVYPTYAASLFAGNDFTRSSLAFAALLFSHPMFEGIGVGQGISILGAFDAACIGGIIYLFFFGEQMRAKSKFSTK